MSAHTLQKDITKLAEITVATAVISAQSVALALVVLIANL